jgi:hypothetical protein
METQATVALALLVITVNLPTKVPIIRSVTLSNHTDNYNVGNPVPFLKFHMIMHQVKAKVKPSLYRLGQAHRASGGWGFQNF